MAGRIARTNGFCFVVRRAFDSGGPTKSVNERPIAGRSAAGNGSRRAPGKADRSAGVGIGRPVFDLARDFADGPRRTADRLSPRARSTRSMRSGLPERGRWMMGSTPGAPDAPVRRNPRVPRTFVSWSCDGWIVALGIATSGFDRWRRTGGSRARRNAVATAAASSERQRCPAQRSSSSRRRPRGRMRRAATDRECPVVRRFKPRRAGRWGRGPRACGPSLFRERARRPGRAGCQRRSSRSSRPWRCGGDKPAT